MAFSLVIILVEDEHNTTHWGNTGHGRNSVSASIMVRAMNNKKESPGIIQYVHQRKCSMPIGHFILMHLHRNFAV